MNLNKQEKKLKSLRALDKKRNEIYNSHRGYRKDMFIEYVPVEEPQFIGWEYSVILEESARNRSDSAQLLSLLRYISRPLTFFKSVDFLRYIRSNGHNLDNIYNHNTGKQRFSRDVEAIIHRSLDYNRYLNLEEKLKCYYERMDYYNPWSGWYTSYELSSRFPMYQLRLKVKPTYSTHRGLPIADNIRDVQLIREKLTEEHYWCTKNGFRNSRWDELDKERANTHRRVMWRNIKNILTTDNAEDMVERFEANLKYK